MIERSIGRFKDALKEAKSPSISRAKKLAKEIDECIEFSFPREMHSHKKTILIHSNRLTIGFLTHGRYFYEELVIDHEKGNFYTERFTIDTKKTEFTHEIENSKGRYQDQSLEESDLERMRVKIIGTSPAYRAHKESLSSSKSSVSS